MAGVKQPTATPTKKWQAGAWAGGVSAIVMGVWAVFYPEQYARVPPGMEAGLAVVLAKTVEYFTLEHG